VVEVMPVAEFPGRFGWGYDGVFPYAPCRIYGTPDDFRSFVDAAHQIGLGVILDVVYNHLGPAGCVHREFADAYFSKDYDNEWGDALNFDGPDAGPVREYFIQNAAHWIDEYRLDGLRLDDIQGIHDRSPAPVLAAITTRARAAGGNRPIIIVAENERQECFAMHPVTAGGYGVDAAWNDDFHHSAYVRLTGRREAYFSDHRGAPQESTGICSRDSGIRGRSSLGERAATTCRRRPSSTTSRITTRWRTRGTDPAFTGTVRPQAIAR
jgi:maltooligosyltrehalose trehalohydrolase